MPHDDRASAQQPARPELEAELKEVVMGLHWHPPRDGAVVPGGPANLDAWCIMLDRDGQALEIITPSHPRNANGSVVHTGNSRTGASEWDDERIFVFLDALPQAVSELTFIVTSTAGRGFGDVPGAFCHVSDRVTESEWVRTDLTALGDRQACLVATLRRVRGGWKIDPDPADRSEGP